MADYPNFAGEAQFKDTASVPTPPANNLAVYSDGGVLKTKNSSGAVKSVSADMVGATSSVAGTAGLVPAPAAGDQRKFLTGGATFLNVADQALPTTPIRRTNGIAFASNGGNSQGARATNTGYVLCPYIYIFSTKAYTTYSIYVSGAGTASSLGKLAIYTIGSSGAPDSLICESGTFATDSTGLKQPTMSSTVVNCGWYFCLVATNSSANVTFYGDAMSWPRGFLSGQVSGATPVGLDYSQKAYANLWPNPWDGTGNAFGNAYHPVVELT